MRAMFGWLKRLHRDDRGASSPASTILKIALIVIPLLIVVLLFRDEIMQMFDSATDDLRDHQRPAGGGN